MRIAILGPLPSQLSALRRAFPDDEILEIRRCDRCDRFDLPNADLFVGWARFLSHKQTARLRQIAGKRPTLVSLAGGVSGVVREIRGRVQG